MFDKKKLTAKEKEFLRVFNKKSKDGENEAVEVKVYTSLVGNSSAIYPITPDDGPLDPHQTLQELNEFMDDNHDEFAKFVIKVKSNSKDKGTPVIVQGGKKQNAFGRNNNKSSMSIGGTDAGTLGLILQLVDKNNNTGNDFKKFKYKLSKKQQKQKRKDQDREFARKFKKHKKKQKKKLKAIKSENSVLGVIKQMIKSPMASQVVKGLGARVLGDAMPSNLYQVETPIEYGNVAGPPKAATPKPEPQKKPKSEPEPKPNETTNEIIELPKNTIPANVPMEQYEQELQTEIEMTLDQQKAQAALALLEKNNFEASGDLMFAAAHLVGSVLGSFKGKMLLGMLEDRKDKAMKDLVLSNNPITTDNQKKAAEALQLLENYELAAPGDTIFIAAHFIVSERNTSDGQDLLKALNDHKAKALPDLIID